MQLLKIPVHFEHGDMQTEQIPPRVRLIGRVPTGQTDKQVLF